MSGHWKSRRAYTSDKQNSDLNWCWHKEPTVTVRVCRKKCLTSFISHDSSDKKAWIPDSFTSQMDNRKFLYEPFWWTSLINLHSLCADHTRASRRAFKSYRSRTMFHLKKKRKKKHKRMLTTHYNLKKKKKSYEQCLLACIHVHVG